MTAKKKKASEPEDIPFEEAMGKLETIVGGPMRRTDAPMVVRA